MRPEYKPCVHAVPQADGCLHGICVCCWRDRLAKALNERDEILAKYEAVWNTCTVTFWHAETNHGDHGYTTFNPGTKTDSRQRIEARMQQPTKHNPDAPGTTE